MMKLIYVLINIFIFGLHAQAKNLNNIIHYTLPEVAIIQPAKVALKSNLPLVLFPSNNKEKLPLAFFISGDGGWRSFDQTLCEKFVGKGMSVIGLNAQKYFWNEKQPKKVADEISEAILQYMKKWNINSFVLIGYSFGACVAPFIADNFSNTLKENLKGVYCFSPDEFCDFEVHISDMLNINTKEKYDVLGELKKIKTLNPICIFGKEEETKLIKHFSIPGIKVEMLPGDHHFNKDYNALAAIVLKDL